MKTVVLIIIAIMAMLFGVGACIEASISRDTLEKIKKETKANADATAEKTAAANKTKADARTGDHNADIKYMADKLHDYANK